MLDLRQYNAAYLNGMVLTSPEATRFGVVCRLSLVLFDNVPGLWWRDNLEAQLKMVFVGAATLEPKEPRNGDQARE